MKKIVDILFYIAAVAGAAILTVAGSSCSNEGYAYISDNDPSGGVIIHTERNITVIVTIKQDTDGSTFLQYKDSIRFLPASNYTFERMQRAMAELYVTGREGKSNDYTVKINWIETLDEGSFATGALMNGAFKETDGKDAGLDIINDWMTVVEDGYLVAHYSTWWGIHPLHHDFYLLSGTDPGNPYLLVLLQDNHGDYKEYQGDGLICFDINALPDTGEESKTITLKWTDTKGNERTADFDFKTRR